MKSSILLALCGSILLGVVPGCGGDDDQTAQGASGGQSAGGSGAGATSGGSSGAAGHSANSGTAGNSGAAGNSTGGTGSGGTGLGTCAQLVPLRYFESDPSAVAMLFSVQDCDSGIPVTGLDEGDFEVKEDNESLSSESHRDVLPGRGYQVVVDLLLDFSNSTLPIRDTLIVGAKSFVDEILVQRNLSEKAFIGIVLFDGSDSIQRYELPTGDATKLFTALDNLTVQQPVDGGATNLNGALRQGVDQLQSRVGQIMDSNRGGVVSTGHLVLFTDGGDTAGREGPEGATSAVQAARVLQTSASGPSTVVQTWAVALDSEDYDGAALENLLGDKKYVLESSDISVLEATFDKMGGLIGAQVEGTYLFAYCSPKRMGEHSVSVGLRPSVVPTSQGMSFSFSADGFGGGCDAAFFESACDGKQCGGFACGGCDIETSVCTVDLQCVP